MSLNKTSAILDMGLVILHGVGRWCFRRRSTIDVQVPGEVDWPADHMCYAGQSTSSGHLPARGRAYDDNKRWENGREAIREK